MNTTVIEVNGVKLEVDLRTAKRIDQLQIGSRVKCLVKTYDSWAVYPGVVVGFDPFPSKPTINVAYINTGYGGGLTFKAFHSGVTDFEVVADVDENRLEVDKAAFLKKMDNEIEAKRIELQKVEDQKAYFLKNFGAYFADFVPAA